MSNTAFIHDRIGTSAGPLFVDGNSKITADDGTFAAPVPNAFSLPHIATCPGSTPACRAGCYVHGLEAKSRETFELYKRNEMTIHRALMTTQSADKTAEALAEYIRDAGLTRFRWHVSGDVFSLRYAMWIAKVCALAPGTDFWIYTRTLVAISTLYSAQSNLTINVSADRDNYQGAARVADAWGLNLCYFAGDGEMPPTGVDVIFPDYPNRARGGSLARHPWYSRLSKEKRRAICPADFFGQSQQHRCGPCKKCL